jgi:regulator of ribonuclease activity A
VTAGLLDIVAAEPQRPGMTTVTGVRMSPMTADLLDTHPDAEAAGLPFRDFGAVKCFHGPVATLKVFEDNALVKTLLEEPGGGRVLVVDGGGSMRCALVGGNLARSALDHGWCGLLINGCIRDAEEIAGIAIGVKALGTHPRRSEKGLHTGHRHRPVAFAGLTFRDGWWLYADSDGIVLSATALHL